MRFTEIKITSVLLILEVDEDVLDSAIHAANSGATHTSPAPSRPPSPHRMFHSFLLGARGKGVVEVRSGKRDSGHDVAVFPLHLEAQLVLSGPQTQLRDGRCPTFLVDAAHSSHWGRGTSSRRAAARTWRIWRCYRRWRGHQLWL